MTVLGLILIQNSRDFFSPAERLKLMITLRVLAAGGKPNIYAVIFTTSNIVLIPPFDVPVLSKT